MIKYVKIKQAEVAKSEYATDLKSVVFEKRHMGSNPIFGNIFFEL